MLFPDAAFPRAAYAKLLGRPLDALRDLASVEPELARGLRQVHNAMEWNGTLCHGLRQVRVLDDERIAAQWNGKFVNELE